MGGNTGNIRTYRISASNGYRTLGSILANGSSGAGAGSTRRVYAWYARNGTNIGNGFYKEGKSKTDQSVGGQMWRIDYDYIKKGVDNGDFEYVYNLAAEFGRKNGEDYYEQLWETNAIGLKNVLKLQEKKKFLITILFLKQISNHHGI